MTLQECVPLLLLGGDEVLTLYSAFSDTTPLERRALLLPAEGKRLGSQICLCQCVCEGWGGVGEVGPQYFYVMFCWSKAVIT